MMVQRCMRVVSGERAPCRIEICEVVYVVRGTCRILVQCTTTCVVCTVYRTMSIMRNILRIYVPCLSWDDFFLTYWISNASIRWKIFNCEGCTRNKREVRVRVDARCTALCLECVECLIDFFFPS